MKKRFPKKAHNIYTPLTNVQTNDLELNFQLTSISISPWTALSSITVSKRPREEAIELDKKVRFTGVAMGGLVIFGECPVCSSGLLERIHW